MTVIRGIYIKGAGLEHLWPTVLALLGLGTVAFAAAVVPFQKKLDEPRTSPQPLPLWVDTRTFREVSGGGQGGRVH